jgi:hypothetical protein
VLDPVSQQDPIVQVHGSITLGRYVSSYNPCDRYRFSAGLHNAGLAVVAFPPGSSLNDQNFTGKNCVQPATVKLRMDFRDRNIVGTFLYHCHILEHEDHGMMAKIRLK